MSVVIREKLKARAYSQIYPDVHYYVGEKKLHIYYQFERMPRLSFIRDGGYYVLEDRVRKGSIREVLDWAVRQPEFNGLPLRAPQNKLLPF